jgi:Ca2+-binding RTX toxin-like protein
MATIKGKAGRDVIFGTKAKDTIYGNGGDDEIFGNGGDDTILGGGGIDTIYGGDGNDMIRGDHGDTPVADSLGDFLYGEAGNDDLGGGFGDDFIDGGIGNDKLWGDMGNDTLLGGDGADWLRGFTGADWLSGGDGADSFNYFSVNDSTLATSADPSNPLGVDWIVDFQRGLDRIDLSLIDADGAGSVNAFSFIGTTGFTGVAGQLRYFYDPMNDRTVIEGDVDGVLDAGGNAAAELTIYLGGNIALTAGDFML